MMKKLNFLKLFFLVILFFIFMSHINKVLAASLQFEPTTANLPLNQNLEIKVIVDAENDEITSTDAYVLYDQTLLEVVEIKNGALFPTITHDITTPGKIYIAGAIDNPTTPITGKDVLATIVFKGKKSGQATLSFDCVEGSSNESNIAKREIDAPDIIQCQLNNRATINIGSGNYSQNQGGLNQLPQSGFYEQFKTFSLYGVLFIIIGVASKLFLKNFN